MKNLKNVFNADFADGADYKNKNQCNLCNQRLNGCSAVHLTTDYRRLAQIKTNKTKSVKIRANPWLNGFSLVELMIVVAILGILAAVAFPLFADHVQKAKESAAKDNLRILRNAIEVYAGEHNSAPGYINGVNGPRGTFLIQLVYCTNANGQYINSKVPRDNYIYGPYVSDFPKNPFNNLITVMDLPDDVDMPESATGGNGWFYKARNKEIRLNWPGTDSEGKAYIEY